MVDRNLEASGTHKSADSSPIAVSSNPTQLTDPDLEEFHSYVTQDVEQKPSYDALVNQYRSLAKKSAQNIIAIAETVYEVKKTYEVKFEQFCAEVGLDDPAKISKWVAIGEKA